MPASIDQIVVTAGERRWQFTRLGGQWAAGTPPLPVPAATADQLDAGLLLLHNSAPERFIAADEARDLARYGLAPPALTVHLRGAWSFAIEFGGTNPLGVARYARLPGQAEVAILPAFVADTWEQAVGLR